MIKSATNRRRFLRGMGACLSLPAFESFLTGNARAASTSALATTATGAPNRMAFIYFPNGAIMINGGPPAAERISLWEPHFPLWKA